MHVTKNAAMIVDPRRSVVGAPPKQPAPQPQPQMSRIEQQRLMAYQMIEQLGKDAKLAAIMLNPVFAPHANAIAMRATARAIYRYETEVPQKDFGALMAEERANARKEIAGLPRAYGQAVVAAGDAVADGAKKTGEYAVAGAKTVGTGILAGIAAVGMGLMEAGQFLLRGLGKGLSGLGNLYKTAGDKLIQVGEQ